ncbi:MAG TPA: hypothetical protein VIY47_16385, partial [Ignavibacteriaceae bacterium]
MFTTLKKFESTDLNAILGLFLDEPHAYKSMADIQEEIDIGEKGRLAGLLHYMTHQSSDLIRGYGINSQGHKVWVYALTAENLPTIGENFTTTVRTKKQLEDVTLVMKDIEYQEIGENSLVQENEIPVNFDQVRVYVHQGSCSYSSEEDQENPIREIDPIEDINVIQMDTYRTDNQNGLMAQDVMLRWMGFTSIPTPPPPKVDSKIIRMEDVEDCSQNGIMSRAGTINRDALQLLILDTFAENPGPLTIRQLAQEAKKIRPEKTSSLSTEALRKAMNRRVRKMVEKGILDEIPFMEERHLSKTGGASSFCVATRKPEVQKTKTGKIYDFASLNQNNKNETRNKESLID